MASLPHQCQPGSSYYDTDSMSQNAESSNVRLACSRLLHLGRERVLCT